MDIAFLHSDSGTMFVHEDASEGAEGDVRLGVIGRLTLGLGTKSVHKGVVGRGVEDINGMELDLEFRTRSVQEESTSKVVGGMDNGVIEGMVLGSGLSLSSVAKGAGVMDLADQRILNMSRSCGYNVVSEFNDSEWMRLQQPSRDR